MHESADAAGASPLALLTRSWGEEGLYESAVLLVGVHPGTEGLDERQRFVGAWGAPPDALFDLASLTKPVLATAVLWECARGRLDLDERVFPEHLGDGAPSLDQLLRHNAGARPWWPLYAHASGGPGSDLLQPLLASGHWGGECGVYSDLGMMCAARWCERRTGSPVLHSMADSLRALLPDVAVEAGPMPKLEVAEPGTAPVRAPLMPCSLDTDKEVELAKALELGIEALGAPPTGWPQDGNARWAAAAGAVAGHAGLAATAELILRFGQLWLSVAQGRAVLPPELETTATVSAWRNLAQRALQRVEGRRLCWFDRDGSAPVLSSESFGHTGFTGGSLWIDPGRSLVAVALGHRCDPLSDLGPARREFLEEATALSG